MLVHIDKYTYIVVVFLFYVCQIIIREFCHIVLVKSSRRINAFWGFPQFILCPLVCEDHFYKRRIERLLSILKEKVMLNFMRYDVIYVLIILVFCKEVMEPLG